MIKDFIYYWKNYDLRTAWWVLLYGDEWIEQSNDFEMWLEESALGEVIKFAYEKEAEYALRLIGMDDNSSEKEYVFTIG